MAKHSAPTQAPTPAGGRALPPARRWARPWWWLAAVPAVVAAVAAGSYTYVETVRPNTYSQVTHVAVGDQGVLVGRVLEDTPAPADATVELLSSGEVPAERVPFFHPATGSVLWGVRFQVTADPDLDLMFCHATLTAQVPALGSTPGGRQEFRYLGEALHKDPDVELPVEDRFACVPGNTPGGGQDWYPPRPGTYEKLLIFVLPEGTTPETLTLSLDPPHALELALPAPSDVVPAT
ncbi:hypothetical protein C1Y63_01890 [Corynebacterium sp. 13CS0277]|uniref:hypothetical protein n=1 Tax=Corynebacterium sp. 13CS0277 TaxID=2071994 RepID=UPI000D036586|nr:hypothetical protein [Corynebacterium sp. 13CS0277]PRQ12326.1 hypothetical protein C1Y63_01890 [Corynebacterium sp. 13CS0277]